LKLSEYATFDAIGLAKLVERREVSPKELVQHTFQLIERLNPHLNAVAATFFEKAKEVVERSLPNGRFRGVPFLLKDNFSSVKNIPINMGSRFAQETTASANSELMNRFNRAGFITVGTTTTPEFAYSATTESILYGPTHNPWDIQLSPGGSSGGAAASVASGIVPLAHGNDGAGSIRIPAACTGLIGLKPTRGRIPTGPFRAEPLNGLAVDFALTKTVRDTAALLDCLCSPLPGSYSYVKPPSKLYEHIIKERVEPLKIAWTERLYNEFAVDEACITTLHEVVHLLENLGHVVVEDKPKVDVDLLQKAMLTIWTANIAHSIDQLAKKNKRKPNEHNLEPVIWRSYNYGKRVTASQLLEALQMNSDISYLVSKFFMDYDLFLTPTIAKEFIRIGELNANDCDISAEEWANMSFRYVPFTNLFNITGQPAISLPLGWTKNNKPIGMQFVAKFSDEKTLLQLAAQLERAKPWKNFVPNVHATNI